ncbi:MAG TPA: GNAT family N-acetyltransferase [Actinomycetota bacterium]|nr:GNAT family N-acetyltransferase [Actinomycetota bacterium]
MQHFTRLMPADFDAYYALRGAGLAETPAAFTTDETSWRDADRAIVERHLEASGGDPNRPIFGAWNDGELVGLVGLARETRDSIFHKATLWGLYVSPEHRRQGIGRRLLTEAVTAARELAGLLHLRAVVPTSCVAAVGLFDGLGFEQFGLERDARRVGGRFHDQLYLWYRLRENQDQ